MKTTLWSPWLSAEAEIRSALERFERMFADGEGMTHRRPAVDVFEDEGKLIVKMELPGADMHDVDISVDEDMLDISGETRSEHESTDKGVHISERRFGSFRRRIMLPDGVDPDAITAAYEHGILTVMAPLPEPAKHEAKKITVTTLDD